MRHLAVVCILLASGARADGDRTKGIDEYLSRCALGWGMADTRRGTRRVGHSGDVRGFHAEIERFPAERTTIIVLCNVEGVPLWTVAWNLEALVFGETPPYPMPPGVAEVPAEALDRLVGRYAVDEDDFIVVERDKSGGLLVGGEGTRSSAALTGPPAGDFGKEIRAAEEIVAAVRRSDAPPIAAVLMKGIPEMWPKLLVDIIWPRHVGRWRELKDVRTLGAAALGPGRVRILMELRHTGGAPHLAIVLQDGRLNIFDLDGPRFAVASVYQPLGPAEFCRLRVARSSAADAPLRGRKPRPRRPGGRGARVPDRCRQAALTAGGSCAPPAIQRPALRRPPRPARAPEEHERNQPMQWLGAHCASNQPTPATIDRRRPICLHWAPLQLLKGRDKHARSRPSADGAHCNRMQQRSDHAQLHSPAADIG